MDAAADGAEGTRMPAKAGSGPAPDDGLSELRAELESAGDLVLDERLALLRRTESTIARALEGLDGL